MTFIHSILYENREVECKAIVNIQYCSILNSKRQSVDFKTSICETSSLSGDISVNVKA